MLGTKVVFRVVCFKCQIVPNTPNARFQSCMTHTAASLLATELYFRRHNFSPVQKEFQKCIVSLTVFKMTEKVTFKIASEASYVYVFGGQILIKDVKNGQKVLPDRLL